MIRRFYVLGDTPTFADDSGVSARALFGHEGHAGTIAGRYPLGGGALAQRVAARALRRALDAAADEPREAVALTAAAGGDLLPGGRPGGDVRVKARRFLGAALEASSELYRAPGKRLFGL